MRIIRQHDVQHLCEQDPVWDERTVWADLVWQRADDAVGGDPGRAGLHGRRGFNHADWMDGVPPTPAVML